MTVTLNTIIEEVKDKIKFEVCCCEELLEVSEVKFKEVNILGIELNGYLKDFKGGQVQIINSKGLKFLAALENSKQETYLSQFFSYNIPVIVFSDDNRPDERFLNLARANHIPILRTELPKWYIVHRLEKKLGELFAPKKDVRGTMMEIFGSGVLITGKSNIGKSECAIDLVQRGHRLIGDDIVEVAKRGDMVLIAKGKFPISHRMELRGIGIVDIVRLFGISAIKEVEKIELIVGLEKWESEKSYERLGIEEKSREILGVSIPYVEIPVAPGRNIALLVEVAAMNFRLRERGIIPAEELEQEVIKSYREEN